MTFAGVAAAGPLTLTFGGSITAGSSDLSKFELLYYGTNGTDMLRGFQPLYNAGTTDRFCAAGDTCSVEATISGFVPDGWATTAQSGFTIIGWYGAGPGPEDLSGFNVISNPGVFVLGRSGLDFSGVDFATAFGYSENSISTHVKNGWSESFSAFQDGQNFVSDNLLNLPNLVLGGASSGGTVWDFTNGVSNGSASLQGGVVSDTPEPATGLVLVGALGILLGVHRRARV